MRFSRASIPILNFSLEREGGERRWREQRYRRGREDGGRGRGRGTEEGDGKQEGVAEVIWGDTCT